LFALAVGTGLGEKTGAVEIDIGIEVLLIEVIDERCPALGNMCVAEQFPDYGAVFSLRQGVVVNVT
jgi:hypothetical protein